LRARVVATPAQRLTAEGLGSEIERLAGLSTLELVDQAPESTGSARLVADGAEVFIPLAGVLDLDVERRRLERRLADLERGVARSQAKLANDEFVSKAPAAVVEQERARLEESKREEAALT